MAPRMDRWPIPTPFPVGPVNAWRIHGARPALVDAGPNTPEARRVLLGHLAQDPVGLLVLTHEHVDHAGLAATLQADHGVEVHVHERDADILRTWHGRRQDREDDHRAALRAAGVPADVIEGLRRGGRKYDAWGQTLRPDATFSHGDTLPLGDHDWRVTDAPGHTPGSYLLHVPGTTLTGDTLLEHITPNALSVKAHERRALAHYLESLRRIQGHDWGTAHPGHGPPFVDVDRVVQRNLDHARERQAHLASELAQGPTTAWRLVGRLFPHLGRGQAFLAVSEVLGHLEVLRLEGRALVERADGIDAYRLAP